MVSHGWTILLAVVSLDAASALSLHNAASQALESSEDCTCLNWKETYAKNSGACGLGNELYFAIQDKKLSHEDMLGLKKYVGAEFCERFYETLDDNYCVNVNMGEDHGQWCYVDSKCAKGKQVENMSGLAVKSCAAMGGDKMLRNYEPEEIAALAKKSNLDVALLHKMSYPLHKKFQWKDVSSFWNVPVEALKEVPPAVLASNKGQIHLPTLFDIQRYLKPRWGAPTLSAAQKDEMQAIMDSGLPHSFDTDNDQHPPHVIVQGKKVYLIFGDMVCLSGC